MNKLDEIFKDTKSPAEYAREYLNHLTDIAASMDADAIGEMIEAFLEARENGKVIYFIGNGGSAATASHFANDISVGTRTQESGKHFKALSLCDNVAVLTALGNDDGYDAIFTRQLEVFLKEGDLVVAISASGNSPNIISGVEFSKSVGAKVIGLTGFDGGKLRELSDINVHVQTRKAEYGPVEDFHMIVDHLLNTYLYRAVRA